MRRTEDLLDLDYLAIIDNPNLTKEDWAALAKDTKAKVRQTPINQDTDLRLRKTLILAIQRSEGYTAAWFALTKMGFEIYISPENFKRIKDSDPQTLKLFRDLSEIGNLMRKWARQ